MAGSQSKYQMLPVDDAIQIVLTEAESGVYTPLVNLEESVAAVLGKRLATTITAPHNVPPFRASVMDGYAVVAADGPGVYTVISVETAGEKSGGSVVPGTIAYITTGAAVPPGADAVIPVEQTEAVEGGQVRIMTTVEPNRWIRAVGSDIATGETVLHEGTVLGAAEIGLLATVGVTNVAVYGSPSVGVMSTGNELVKPSTATTGSQIHDSNRSMLLAAVTESGGDAVDLGIVPDDVGAFEARLREAWANRVDIVVTSGGVSMGSLDLVKPTLERIGTVHFGRLNMKPGKPTTYATIEIDGVKKHIFALPGNPVSSLVTFKLLVDPCIKRFAGARPEECHHRRVTARLAQPLTLDPARPEYHRAVLEWCTYPGDGRKLGGFVAHSTGTQRSSRLLSMRGANALVCVPQGKGVLHANSTVTALLLSQREGFHMLPPPTIMSHQAPEAPATRFAAPTATSAAPAKYTGCMCCKPAEAGGEPAFAVPAVVALQGGTALKGSTVLHCGVVTVSDRASRGEYADAGGPEVCRVLGTLVQSEWKVTRRTVPDEEDAIVAAITALVDTEGCGLVITTGGTGPAKRDVTPEATRRVIDKELPGIGEAMRAISLRYVPTAVLSRQLCGIRGDSVVVNLPGSPRSIGQIFPEIAQPLAHCMYLLREATVIMVGEFAEPADAAAAVVTAPDPPSMPAAGVAGLPPPQPPQAGRGADIVPARSTAAAGSSSVYAIDRVNEEWMDKMLQRMPQATSPTELVERCVTFAREEADEAFVFEKVRGCDRKKEKRSIALGLTEETLAYLRESAAKYNLPNEQKALRVVLDYALEDGMLQRALVLPRAQ